MKRPKSRSFLSPRRSIYLLPNIFTTVALFAGLYAIIAGIDHHFNAAVVAVYIAMIMDSLDGRIARLTKTQSAFGAQYDSLSDMVAFAVAPALVSYIWLLHDLKRLGWAITFLYVACTALRLARFNAQLNQTDPRYFKGLPCPAAAAVVMGLILVAQNNGFSPSYMGLLMGSVMVGVGVLMVSNLLYYSFKQFHFKGRVPFMTLLAMVLLFVFVILDPFEILFIVFSLYALSGPTLALWRWVKKKKASLK